MALVQFDAEPGQRERNLDQMQRLVARYRKTWLYKTDADEGFRTEWARYDPGTGPEAFEILGLRATCLICADADSPVRSRGCAAWSPR